MKIIRGIIAGVVLVLLFTVPVFAIAPPTDIAILSAKVARNTVETGDWSIVFHYRIEDVTYPPYPTTSASETIIFRLYAADGTTLLGLTVPYSYFNLGYGNGASSFYFSDAEATALGLVWGSAYKINIASPIYFTPSPAPYYHILSTPEYSPVTDRVANQVVMKSYILGLCDSLETAYPTVTLHGSTDVGIVLTDTGEAYFRGAVPGIASIAPTLFFIQTYVPEPIEIIYTTAKQDTYTARLLGTDLMAGFDAIGTLFGVSGESAVAILVILLCIALIIFTAWKNWGVEPGILGSGIILTCGSLLFGGALFTIRMIMALIGGILLFYQLFFKKA